MFKMKGSNLVEYVIPILLVGLVLGVGIYQYADHGQLLTFISSSGNMQLDGTKKQLIIGNQASNGFIVSEKDISGMNVKVYQDGSLSFSLDNNKVTIPKKVVDLANTVAETTGSIGGEILVKEIADMIQNSNDEFSYSTTPIEVYFGSGTRAASKGSNASYSGQTQTVIVGDSFSITQNDQQLANNNANQPQDSLYQGIYKINGTIKQNGTIQATVKKFDEIATNQDVQIIDLTGKFIGKLKKSKNALNINGATYNQQAILKNLKGKVSNDNVQYKWVLSFNNPDYQFKL